MKYNRPVRELLVDCVRELHQPFTREAVIEWFRLHYPDVKSSTVTAHMVGLTVGRNPETYPLLMRYPPVLERVSHGIYQRAGGGRLAADAGPTTSATVPRPVRARQRPTTASPDVVLVGCVKSKRSTPAPASDLYTSTLFGRRREYAEASGAPWFVVSSRWGLVAPDEVIAPYDVYLGEMPTAYRRAWGEFVVEQLRQYLDLRGAVVEIHAGDHYVDALRPAIERAGATLVDPVDAHSMGETLAWYGTPTPAQPGRASSSTSADAVDSDIEALIAALLEADAALTPAELQRLPRPDLASPGLYTWWVDDDGAADLANGLQHAVTPGLIYAGQAGATRRISRKRSTNTLHGRLLGMHLRGHAGISTFRLTLGSTLWPLWGGRADEAALTSWMEAHLRVVPVPVPDADTLDDVETAVLTELDPPLNLAKMPRTPLREELTRLRRRYARNV